MSGRKFTLLEKYKQLPAGYRTGIIGGAVVLSMFVVGTYALPDNSGSPSTKPVGTKENLNIYNPGNSNATEVVAASLEKAKIRITEQDQKIQLLLTQSTRQSEGAVTDGHWSEISNLTSQLQGLQEKVNAMTDKGGAKGGDKGGEKGGSGSPSSKDSALLDKMLPQGSDNGKGSNAKSISDSGSSSDGDDGSSSSAPPSAPVVTIQVVGADEKKVAKGAVKKDVPPAYIPSGSNFEGVLLTGMDASTAIGANRNPTPALLRIKTDAILPNLFTFNVRECFVMVGGFGNISTERVEMRTETMSCVAESGEVYEGKIEGYLVGEDGKAGARGRVVSKQGSLLAKSFMAGMVGGIGSAFTPQAIPALNVSGGSTPAYQYPNANQVVGNGLSSGLNKSSQALANFYIKLAEQMFPIVELDAGRKMTIILLKGVDLKMEKKL